MNLRITLILALVATFTGFAQNAPIDFEAGGQGAAWTWTVFENADNPPLAIVPNPDPTGVNTSSTVAEFTARDLGEPFAGVESMHGADIGTFDLTAANAYVSIKVYKTKISDVGIKFATPPGGAQPEIKVANTLINQWETITFNFTSYIGLPETTGLDQIIIFPDFVDRTADDVIYFDDITFSDTPPAGGVELPVTFEDPALNYVFEGFEGADSAIEANAVSGGINTSATVMRSIKTVGSQFFAGTSVDIDVPLDIATSEVIRIKTYSPKANIPVRLALETAGVGGTQVVVDVNTTVQDEWETLTFNFSGQLNPAVTYNRIVVFFEFIPGLAGDGSTYYFDDIEQLLVTPVELPVTFEDPMALYQFAGFEGADSAIEANAVSGGINTSATVMRSIKTVGAQFFAGTLLDLDVPIDFSTPAEISIKTYSPKANIPIRLAIETAGVGGTQVFVDVNTTVVDEWETLTFDFTGILNPAVVYDRVVVFFEFIPGLPGDGSTYYYDDLEVFVPTPVELPVTFEDTTSNYMFAGFEGADSAIEANAVSGGINTSATVMRSTKTSGSEFFAGTSLELDVPIDFSSTELIQVKTYSPKANIPVRMRLENAANTVGIEVDVNTTVIDDWEVLTFDFDGQTLGVDWVRVKMIFEYVPGVMGDDSTYYFDDVELLVIPPTPVELPVTFEDATANYVFVGFEGADSAIEANAVSGGINTSATVMRSIKTVGAQFFAGTFLDLDVPIDFSTSEMLSIKTYSPKANIPVRLALETAGVGGTQIFADVNTTVVDEWEILTYDFSGLIDPAVDYNRVVVFFEFIDGLAGDGSTYYYDDIEVFTPAGTPVELPVTFEDATANYMFVGFEGADSAIEANAVSGGINTSATVMRSIKTVGAQFFAGTALEIEVPIDFSTSEMLSVKTYSPKAGIPVKMRLENADNSVGIEVDVNTTVIDEWETLTYDFTGQTAGVDFVRVVMFFEFIDGLAGDGSTYYFDDIEVAEPLGVSEFENTSVVVYPNPATDIVNVQSTTQIAEVTITSITGQLVLRERPNQLNTQLNVESFSTGVYLISITTETGNSETIRFIKK